MVLTAIDVSVRVKNLTNTNLYVVIPGYFSEEVSMIDLNQLRKDMVAAQVIFQQRGSKNDKKRTQLREGYLPKQHRDIVGLISNELEKVFKKVGRGRLSDGSVLKSESKCGRQQLHRDFNYAAEPRLTMLSYLVMVAAQDNTKLVVLIDGKEEVITLNKGDLFIGRGDLIHAGAAYKRWNIRLHWFVDYGRNKRKDNETYLYDLPTNTFSIDDYYAGFYKAVEKNLMLAEEAKKRIRDDKEIMNEKMKQMRSKKLAKLA